MIIVKVIAKEEGRETPIFLGTAFFINSTTLLTAKHIFDGVMSSEEELLPQYRIYITEIPRGGEVPVTITLCDNRDIATLKSDHEFEEVGQVMFTNPKRETWVDIKAYTSMETAIEPQKHYVINAENEYYTFRLQHPVIEGFSGSPVMFEDKVCGITQATDTRVTYIIPMSEVCNKCDKQICSEVDEKGEVVTNPYKGLNSFEYKDRHNFYGREEQSKEIAEALQKTRLYTLLGASGSGKTSLIFAGLKPLIEGQDVKILSFRPDKEPFKNLANEFIATLYPDKVQQAIKIDELTGELANDKVKLNNLVQIFFNDTGAEHLYLIIDQFEELFTLTKEQGLKENFLNQLLTIIHSDLPVTLLVAMRTDFLAKLSEYETFNNAFNQYPKLSLTKLSSEQLENVIEKPAENSGNVMFQDGLVERIIKEVENKSGQLPVLEFALQQLWDNKIGKVITHDVLDDIGGVTHAISNHANRVYNDYEADQESIKKVFLKLVSPVKSTKNDNPNDQSDIYDTRRIASLDEFNQEELKTVKLLADYHLVVTKQNSVDIIHEALIREWEQLQNWIREYRELLEWQAQLREDKKNYDEHKAKNDKANLLRDDKLDTAQRLLNKYRNYIPDKDQAFIEKSIEVYESREKTKKWIIAGAFVFLVGVIIVILLLFREAKEQEKKAIRASEEANKSKVLAENKTKETQKLLYDSTMRQSIIHRDYLNEPLKAKLFFAKSVDIGIDLNDTSVNEPKILYDLVNNIRLVDIKEIKDIKGAKLNKAKNEVLIWTAQGKVILWNLVSSKLQIIVEHNKSVIDVKYSSDETEVVSYSEDGTVKLWDRVQNKVKTIIEHEKQIHGIKYHNNEEEIISWGEDGVIKLWLKNKQKSKTIIKYEENISIDEVVIYDNKLVTLMSKDEGKILNFRNLNGEEADKFLNLDDYSSALIYLIEELEDNETKSLKPWKGFKDLQQLSKLLSNFEMSQGEMGYGIASYQKWQNRIFFYENNFYGVSQGFSIISIDLQTGDAIQSSYHTPINGFTYSYNKKWEGDEALNKALFWTPTWENEPKPYLHIWDLESDNVKSFNIDVSNAYFNYLMNEVIVVYSDTIKVLNLEQEKIIVTKTLHHNDIENLVHTDELIISWSNQDIRLWETNYYSKVLKKDLNQSNTNITNNIIYERYFIDDDPIINKIFTNEVLGLWNEKNKNLKTLLENKNLYKVVLSKDKKYIAIVKHGMQNNIELEIWNMKAGTMLVSDKDIGNIPTISFGKSEVTYSFNSATAVYYFRYDLNTGKEKSLIVNGEIDGWYNAEGNLFITYFDNYDESEIGIYDAKQNKLLLSMGNIEQEYIDNGSKIILHNRDRNQSIVLYNIEHISYELKAKVETGSYFDKNSKIKSLSKNEWLEAKEEYKSLLKNKNNENN